LAWQTVGLLQTGLDRINFLRELKAQGTVSVVWISNQFMSSDIFMKNVGGQSIVRHRDMYVRENPVSAGKGVGMMEAVTREDCMDQGMKGASGSLGTGRGNILECAHEVCRQSWNDRRPS
jgi:hypothetical protein